LVRTTLTFLLAASIVELEEGILLDIYNEYFEVFSEKEAATLFPENVNHEINLQLDAKGPPYGPLYPCLAKELEHLCTYLEEIQQKGWI
jgi:hypothetical protein